MSKLNDLRSKGEEVTLSNELKVIITPMTIDEEADIGELYTKDKPMQAIALMVKNAIKRSIPDATEEEINNLNKTDLKLLSTKVLEINGLSQDKQEDQKKD